MKEILRRGGALLLIGCLLMALLSGCGDNTEVVQRTDYDTSNYDLVISLEGCSFIVPKEYYERRVSYDNYESYTAAEKKEQVFEWIGDKSWSCFTPGSCGFYGFKCGTIDHIEGKEDVNTLAGYLQIDDYLTFTPREGAGGQETTSNTDIGDILNVYPVFIHDTLTGDDFYGYVSTYRVGANRKIFACAAGFAEYHKNTDAICKTVVESLAPDTLYES